MVREIEEFVQGLTAYYKVFQDRVWLSQRVLNTMLCL